MLWYKAWLETRSRFLSCLAALMLFSTIFVYHAQRLIRPEWKSDFNHLLFVNQQFVVVAWVLAVVLLGMGGLVRERAIGTSALTLALPVRRARLMAVRIGVSIVEAMVLGIVPWAAVFLVSSLAKMPVSVTQVASYVLLLVGGGLIYLAVAILVSALIAGEYTAPAVAVGIVLLAAIVSDAWLRQWNVWRLVTGDFSIERVTFLLSGHLPWPGIIASLSAAV
jgi:ABC-2 type transport system permease protein